MILIDTSAWIEYYKPSQENAVRNAVSDAIQNDEAATNAIVYVETVGFAKDDRERRLLQEDFSTCHFFDIPEEVSELAAEICFTLRRQGKTIPATDAVIAATALKHGATVLHQDKHFDEIFELFPLA